MGVADPLCVVDLMSGEEGGEGLRRKWVVGPLWVLGSDVSAGHYLQRVDKSYKMKLQIITFNFLTHLQ